MFPTTTRKLSWTESGHWICGRNGFERQRAKFFNLDQRKLTCKCIFYRPVLIMPPSLVCVCVCVLASNPVCFNIQHFILRPFWKKSSPADTTFSSSFTLWESSESWWPFTLLCRSYAELGCTPLDSRTCITCHSTTTTASSSSCCPTSHVRFVLTGKRMKAQSDKHVFGFFCFASVSSALLPHAAAEKKGAPRGGHSGEGRLNRPPPPRRLSGNTLTVPVLQELETEAGDRELFILLTSLTAPFHIRKTTLHLSCTDPSWENWQFFLEVF